MRDILFRGIWVHGNKEWIEGDLVRDSEGKPHIVDNKYAVYWKGEPIFVCEDECEVIPETVGQYMGLTDKNGKKIFEGDIVKMCFVNDYSEIGVIHYSNDTCRFRFVVDENSIGCSFDDTDVMEVIGNIHDNPELLEVN